MQLLLFVAPCCGHYRLLRYIFKSLFTIDYRLIFDHNQSTAVGFGPTRPPGGPRGRKGERSIWGTDRSDNQEDALDV